MIKWEILDSPKPTTSPGIANKPVRSTWGDVKKWQTGGP